MATTSTPEIANAQTVVTNVESWLKVHERLLIVLFVIAFGVFLAQKYFDLSASIENHKFVQSQSVLKAQQDKNTEAIKEAQSALADYKTALQQSKVQNTKLALAVTQRDKQLTQTQTQDKTLPTDQLASKWQSMVGTSEVKSVDAGYQVSVAAGLATVEQLEQVPVLQQNLSDEQQKETNLQNTLDKSNDLITQGKTVVTGLQSQIVDQQKTCSIEVQTAKDNARKSRLKWFGAGFIIGYITGHVW